MEVRRLTLQERRMRVMGPRENRVHFGNSKELKGVDKVVGYKTILPQEEWVGIGLTIFVYQIEN